ncbi:MAG: ABC transporter permease [Anaeromyxobacter sp.]
MPPEITFPAALQRPPPRASHAALAVPAPAAPAVRTRRTPGAWAFARALRTSARRATVPAAGLALPLALLGAWHLSAAHGWVSPLILPPPADVLATFLDCWRDGTISGHLAVSSVRVMRGFGYGAGAGLLLGGALGACPALRAYVRPTLMAVYQVNAMAWLPLLILVFGIDEPLKTAVITLATLLPVTANTMQALAAIPERWLELARVHGLGRLATLRRVVVPAALPALFTGLRGGLAAAWQSLVIVELVASSEGIGFMVVWGRQLFQLDVVLVAIVLIGAVGLALDLVLSTLDRRLHLWQRAAW